MSETRRPRDASDLGELFVSITGDETVTESQQDTPSKRPIESDTRITGADDGLDDAVGADIDSE